MDPWEGNGERPECPRCGQASFMYRVEPNTGRWWCCECMKFWFMPEGIEVGGQDALDV